MSVINKVLRDLDSRAAGPGAPEADMPQAYAGIRIPQGVVAVSPSPAPGPQPRGTAVGWIGGGLALVLVAVLAAQGVWHGPTGTGGTGVPVGPAGPSVPGGVPPSRAGAPPAVNPPQEPAAEASPPGQVSAAAASEALYPAGVARPEALAPLPPPAAVLAPPVGAAPPTAIAPQVPPPGQTPTAPAVAASPPATPPRAVASGPGPTSPPAVRLAANGPAATPAAPPPMVDSAPAPVRSAPVLSWTDAALDAVAQAQRMWAAGGRDTALAFLRDALLGVERIHAKDLPDDPAGSAATLTMVRELVRMEQGLGNHAQVLDVLRRHESLWARQAELWAVRGSAAQRLSQHAEAADAYRTALRLRPGEPRWMLGAAVSLAAQGQLAQAAQFAEQARRSGPVSADVLSYLRQLGVPLGGDNQGN